MRPEFASEIVRAYRAGAFPMGDAQLGISWHSPDPRCVIDLDRFHVSRRLMRTCRKSPFEIRVNSAWDEVIASCAGRESTWITAEIVEAYTQLHRLGLAHSVEAFDGTRLVGGLYGVSLGGAFMGESMFHTADDASKICLVHLVERLRRRGYVLLDCQYMTAHLQKFGAELIARERYLERLGQALSLDCRFD